MTNKEFVEEVARLVKEIAPKYGFHVYSPAIAQAILESNYGNSFKAKFNNLHGLKFRPNRVTCNNGYFEDGGSEQNLDGSYRPLPSDQTWFAFADYAHGIEGYYQFLSNYAPYAKAKAETDPRAYLQILKDAHYATSISYVDNCMRVIKNWDLTRFDPQRTGDNKFYRVYSGSYTQVVNATERMNQIKAKGFSAMLKKNGQNTRVQVAACVKLESAEDVLKKLKKAGFDGFIIFE